MKKWSANTTRLCPHGSATTVIRRCNSVTTTQTLTSAGSSFTFFTSSTTYCSVVANKPVLVSNLAISSGNDNIGDPIISILPSLDQYTNRYSFFSLNTTDFNIHQISVSVLAQYYQPSSIRVDGQPISCSWSAMDIMLDWDSIQVYCVWGIFFEGFKFHSKIRSFREKVSA